MSIETLFTFLDRGCQTGSPRALVVLLHGVRNPLGPKYNRGPESLSDVKNAVRCEMPGADIFVPELPLRPFSLVSADDVCNNLLASVDALYKSAEDTPHPYSKIVLVGHSYGSILARKLLVLAYGATTDATLDPALERPWANKIEKLILLAGMSRGWTTTSAMTAPKRFSFGLATAIGYLLHLVAGKTPVTFDVRRGLHS